MSAKGIFFKTLLPTTKGMKLEKEHFDITDGLRAMDNLGEKGEAGPRLLLLHLFRRNDGNVSKESKKKQKNFINIEMSRARFQCKY